MTETAILTSVPCQQVSCQFPSLMIFQTLCGQHGQPTLTLLGQGCTVGAGGGGGGGLL